MLIFGAQTETDVAHVIASDLRAGRIDEAKQLLSEALKSSPRDARLWTFNGLALAGSGDQTGALASYQRALEFAPEYFPALEGAAEIEYNQHSQAAIPLLRRIVKLRPDDRTAHDMLATLAFEEGDCEAGNKELSAVGSEDGRQTTKNDRLVLKQTRDARLPHTHNTDASATREFGACLVRQKRLAEALPVFERLLLAQPGNAAARSDLAVVQFLAGNYQATVATVEPEVENRTADAGTLDLLAQANEMLGATERALALLEGAIVASPSTAQYYADYAYICLAHGKFQTGIATVDAGLKRLPDAAPLYVARGILRSELAQYEQGEEDFRRAAQLDPHVEFGAAGRGLAELQRNDLPQAETTVREQLRARPSDAFLQYLLAEILVRKGASAGTPEFAEAVAAARTAVELKPDFTLARNTLGQLYLQDGKIEPAIEQFQAALLVNPADEKALYHLIVALRRDNQTAEVPALLKRLVAVRAQNRRQEDLGSQFGAPK